MTPDELAKSGTEHGEQKALMAWAACAARYGFFVADRWSDGMDIKLASTHPISPMPVLSRLHAIHNQGHGDAIRGARARAEGVKRGVPDLCLPVPTNTYHGLYIELKQVKYRNHKGGGLSPEQIDWLGFLNEKGYRAQVAYGWREAALIIKNYLTQ